MEKEKQTSTFNKELKKDYEFEINFNKDFGGSYGQVYFGAMYKKGDTKIPVAIKTSRDGDEFEFIQEKKVVTYLSQQDIPYYVTTYGITHLNGKEYIVMEDLNRVNFITINKFFKDKDLFEKHSGKLESVTKKLKQIKQDLYNSKTIIHGDLRSSNIMINLDNGDVKLIDFGFSKIIKNKDKLTKIERNALEKDIKDLDEIICKFGKIISTHDLQK